MVPLQDFFEHKLGFTVRIDWPLRQVLGHWNPLWRAISSARRAEDELLHAMPDCRVEKIQAATHIVPKILTWIAHGLANQRVSRKMDDRFWPNLLEHLENRRPIRQISLEKTSALVHCGAMSFAQVVEHRDSVICIQQFLDADGTDVPCSSCHQHVHDGAMLARRFARTPSGLVGRGAPAFLRQQYFTGYQGGSTMISC